MTKEAMRNRIVEKEDRASEMAILIQRNYARSSHSDGSLFISGGGEKEQEGAFGNEKGKGEIYGQ